ncbi:MAG: phosphatidylglycerophosphatase A [Patescibacteria group bacterium]
MSPLKKIFGALCMFICTTGMSGMLPMLFGKRGIGAGTISSILTTVVLIELYDQQLHFLVILGLVVISLIVGTVATKYGEQFILEHWGPGKRHTGETVEHDLNEANIDEVHGMLVAVLPIYFIARPFEQFIVLHIIALVMFRIFDVLKPGPIKWVEDNVGKWLGEPAAVMLDDTAAGLASACLVYFAGRYIQLFL